MENYFGVGITRCGTLSTNERQGHRCKHYAMADEISYRMTELRTFYLLCRWYLTITSVYFYYSYNWNYSEAPQFRMVHLSGLQGARRRCLPAQCLREYTLTSLAVETWRRLKELKFFAIDSSIISNQGACESRRSWTQAPFICPEVKVVQFLDGLWFIH